MVRLVVICSGAVGIGWLGLVSNGSFRYCRVSYAVVRFGRRFMVRLGAVLRGTVMYGLVWLAGFVVPGFGALRKGAALLERYRMVGLCPACWGVFRRGKAGTVWRVQFRFCLAS